MPEFLVRATGKVNYTVAPAVAAAAMASGVATLPIEDMAAYRRRLSGFVYKSSNVMEPLFDVAPDLCVPGRGALAELRLRVDRSGVDRLEAA